MALSSVIDAIDAGHFAQYDKHDKPRKCYEDKEQYPCPEILAAREKDRRKYPTLKAAPTKPTFLAPPNPVNGS